MQRAGTQSVRQLSGTPNPAAHTRSAGWPFIRPAARVIMLCSSLLLLLACGATPTAPDGGGPSLEIHPAVIRLSVGETVQLRAEVRDGNGQALAADSVEWSTSDPIISTVSEDGILSAVAVGSTEVSATVRGKGKAYGLLKKSQTVTVEEEEDTSQQTPNTNVVDAGPDQTISVSEAANLAGSVSDGSLVHHFWARVSGPGTVTFGHEEFFSGWESGDFSEWRRHEDRGDYVTSALRRSGRYSWAAHADPTLQDPDNHSAKVLHWGSTDHPRLYISAWFFWPADYRLQEKAGGFLNLLQFKQHDATPNHFPTWIVGARKSKTVTGDGELVIMDWQRVTGEELHHAGVPLPKDRWVNVNVYIEKHHTDGVLVVWVDGQQKWTFGSINTLGSSENQDLMWGVGNFGKDVAEDEVVYWDEVRAWRADQNDVLSTTARFSERGTYVLRLTASGGGASESDDLTITVE